MHETHFGNYWAKTRTELTLVTNTLTCVLCLWSRRLCAFLLILDPLQELLDLTVVSGPLGHNSNSSTQLRLLGLRIIALRRHGTWQLHRKILQSCKLHKRYVVPPFQLVFWQCAKIAQVTFGPLVHLSQASVLAQKYLCNYLISERWG